MQILKRTREIIVKIMSRRKNMISALLGQASSSISSVFVSMWLILFAPKDEFGVYSLCFSIALICAGMISSGLTIQFAVNLPSKAPKDHSASLITYLSIITALCVVGVMLGAALASSGLFSIEFLRLTIICSAMTWAVSARELLIRHMIHGENNSQIRISSASLLITTLILLSLYPAYLSHLHWAAFAYSAAIFTSLVPSLFSNRKGIREVSSSTIGEALIESWHGGRWGIVSNVFFSVRNQAHTLLLAPLGPSVVADVNAARLVFMPMYQITPVISQLGLSAVAKLRSTSERLAIEHGRKLAKFAITPILAFGVVVSLCAFLLKEDIIPEDYWNSTRYLFGWCLVTSAMAGRIAYSTTLQALHQFKSVASGNFASLFALFGTWLILKDLAGAPAILYAMAGSEACVMLIYMRKLSSMKSRISSSKPI